MQRTGISLKVTVISGFILLMAGFVAYKAGLFETETNDPIPAEAKEELSVEARDSIQGVVDSLELIAVMAQSTKIGPIIDDRSRARALLLDSLKLLLDSTYRNSEEVYLDEILDEVADSQSLFINIDSSISRRQFIPQQMLSKGRSL